MAMECRCRLGSGRFLGRDMAKVRVWRVRIASSTRAEGIVSCYFASARLVVSMT